MPRLYLQDDEGPRYPLWLEAHGTDIIIGADELSGGPDRAIAMSRAEARRLADAINQALGAD